MGPWIWLPPSFTLYPFEEERNNGMNRTMENKTTQVFVCVCERERQRDHTGKERDWQGTRAARCGFECHRRRWGVWRTKNIFEVKNIIQEYLCEGRNTSSEGVEPWIFMRKLWAGIYRSSIRASWSFKKVERDKSILKLHTGSLFIDICIWKNVRNWRKGRKEQHRWNKKEKKGRRKMQL